MPVPTQSPAVLQETFARWQSRRAAAVQHGLDPKPVEALYQQDWAKVAAGGTPMTAEQVSASLDAAYGHPDVTKGRRKGILGALENIPTDVAGTLWDLVPGAVNLVHHLPSEVTQTGEYFKHTLTDPHDQMNAWLAAHGYEQAHGGALSQFAEAARNLGRVPLTRLVPGVSTLGAATSKAGRGGLERHPVGTVLDVAPFAGGLAEAGAFGSGLATSIDAGQVADRIEQFQRGGQFELADKLAQERGFSNADEALRSLPKNARTAGALAAGRPVKALVRAVPQLSEARLSLLDHFGLTPRASGTRRVLSAAQTKMARQLDEHARTELAPLIEEGMREEDVGRLGQLAGRPDLWPAASPEDQARLTKLQSYVDARTATDVAENPNQLYRATLAGGKTVIYGGGQATKFFSLQRALDKWTGRVKEARARLEGNDPVAKAKAQSDLAKWGDKLHAADQALQKHLAKTVPAQFKPLVEDQIRVKVMAWLTGQHLAENGQIFQDAMRAFDRGQPLAEYLPPKVLATIKREVTQHWQELAETYNPIWLPTMSSESLDRGLKAPRLSDKPKTPSSWKSSYVNQSAGSSNYALALGQDYANKLAYETNKKLTEDFIRPLARTTTQIDQEMTAEVNKFVKAHPTYSQAEAQNIVRRRAYAPLDDTLGLGAEPTFQKLYKEKLWIPRDVADAVRRSFAPPSDNELRKLNMGSIRLYKHAVMDFSPTHKAHIWLGSMLPLMLGAGVEEFNPHRVLEAWHMARGAAKGTMPDLLNQHLALTAADDLMEFQHGSMLGRLVRSKAGHAVEMSRKLDELGANMYRSWAYLSEEARGLKHGLTDEEAKAQGIAYANKAFVDVANMSPVEQALAKSVFPFYSYTRWALGYVMQYPIDHPIRASILSNLGEQEKAYNDAHGIPNTLSMLFHLGMPNSKGDQWGVQYRALNPFRDTASAFTLAGIFRNLGPVGRVLGTAGGINTLSGTPDPYPGLDVDPNTGSLVGTVRGRSPLSAAEQVVPQLSLLDHYLGLSQQARSLRTSDPQAFRRQVFSILNMPFVPQSYTPYTAAGTRARDQLRVAQGAVSAAVKNQDLGALDIYAQVPVPSKLRAYFGNAQYVATEEFKRVVGLIYQWEQRTGQKVT